MNLYNLHTSPHKLLNNDKRLLIPNIAWEEYKQARWEGDKDLKPYLKGILNSAKTAYSYAEQVKKGPWPEAEDIIATDAESSHDYANYVLNARFKKGEPQIMKDPHWATWYASGIFRGRWPEAEPYILKGPPNYMVRYATDSIKGRWPEAEPYIKQNETAWDHYSDEFRL